MYGNELSAAKPGFTMTTSVGFTAKRLHSIAQGFSPGSGVPASALKGRPKGCLVRIYGLARSLVAMGYIKYAHPLYRRPRPPLSGRFHLCGEPRAKAWAMVYSRCAAKSDRLPGKAPGLIYLGAGRRHTLNLGRFRAVGALTERAQEVRFRQTRRSVQVCDSPATFKVPLRISVFPSSASSRTMVT